MQGNQEAEEPTSTIVLTSQTSHFVDIRLFKDVVNLHETNSSEGVLKPVLEWAFAGISHNKSGYDESKKIEYNHSIWNHWIDSRTDEPSIDEGDLWPQPNGDVLERGIQLHPVTGVKCEYEELWGDLPIKVVEEEEEKRMSLVLKVNDENRNARGLVVRVGQFCQGILKMGNKLTVERWEWVDLAAESEPQGCWRCKVRIGDGSLPCDQTRKIGGLCNGAIVQSGGLEWRVIEDYRW